ncbi:cytochrome P450 [Streptomyces aureoversilis]|uniref:Cytochrome P450 n=2 Tax=Streptomyces aureoversilis TaxID=67277 RepID=A0ABV9ZW04_9ACTN
MTSTDSSQVPVPVHDWAVDDLPALDFDPFMARLLLHEPIARIRLPYGEGHAWLVTRYEDVKLVTSDARFSRRALIGRSVTRLSPHTIPQDEAVGFTDPPRHAQLRKAVARAFSARSMERIRPLVERTAHELLEGMERHGSPADLMEHFNAPLPLTVISEVMGVPSSDRPLMAHWTGVLLTAARTREESEAAKAEIRAYFVALLRRRRAEPREDLAGDLAAAVTSAELSEAEAVALAVLIQISATHAVRNNSANMVYALLTEPGLADRLRAAPAVLPQAVEELLRWIPHRRGVGIARIATQDVEVGGTLIAKGEVVYASYLTANRDPSVFERPDELDVDRPRVPHLSFGHGPHFCLASMLARLESEVMLTGLLARFPHLRLAVPAKEIAWQPAALIRGPETLPVAW